MKYLQQGMNLAVDIIETASVGMLLLMDYIMVFSLAASWLMKSEK